VFAEGGETKTVSSNLKKAEEVIPMYVVGGHVVPTQGSALTVKEARETPLTLIAALTKAVRETGVSRTKGSQGACRLPAKAREGKGRKGLLVAALNIASIP
jgi:alpha-glucosidase (family GH31 glycosyl hydrolase)